MANFTEGVTWKKFMAKLYGLGAAVVIIGALFKLQHWPGAGLMLTIGMGTEAIIFIFSAFEPLPHPDPHWEIIYPELKAGFPTGYFKDGEFHNVSANNKAPAGGAGLAAAHSLDLSGVDTGKLTAGLNKLGETANKLNELSATVASASLLAEKMQQASMSVDNFAQSYENSSQVLSESINILSDSYQGVAKVVTDSGRRAAEDVAKSGQQVVGVLNTASESFAATLTLIDQQVKANLDTIKHSGGSYAKQVESLNKNMTALNTAYELQAQEASKYHKNNVQMGSHLEKLVDDLKRSSDENQAFRKGMAHLNESIVALNAIYGNMLSTIQTATKKKA